MKEHSKERLTTREEFTDAKQIADGGIFLLQLLFTLYYTQTGARLCSPENNSSEVPTYCDDLECSVIGCVDPAHKQNDPSDDANEADESDEADDE